MFCILFSCGCFKFEEGSFIRFLHFQTAVKESEISNIAFAIIENFVCSTSHTQFAYIHTCQFVMAFDMYMQWIEWLLLVVSAIHISTGR